MSTASSLSLDASFARFFDSLSPERLSALGRRMTARARALGLLVVRQGGDEDIASTLTPELFTRETRNRRAKDAAFVLDGIVRTARAILANGPDAPDASRLFGHFGELERHGLLRQLEAEDITIGRVDWFTDAEGRHHALEFNATIPAMPAYSDAAAQAWIETLGEAAGLSETSIASLVERNGSNSDDLRRSLLAHARTALATPTIAIVHRAGDPQQRELEALARRFTAAGCETWLGTPGDVALEGNEAIVTRRRPDILYRHIFARRVPVDSPLALILLGRATVGFQNPINGHLEVKGVLAELSRRVQAGEGEELGLSAQAIEALGRVLPWTRILASVPGQAPDGAKVADLGAFVQATPEAFVLKRSWDYGGKSVLIGRDVAQTEGALRWRELVGHALAEEPGSWIVQQHVDSPLKRHLVLTPEGPAWDRVYVDASTYTASGTVDVPGGGVARFARTGVVNIVGGGGVAPLIQDDVAADIARLLGG